MSVLSCYAPTFAAKREDKDNFFNYLQDVISSIPSNIYWETLRHVLDLEQWWDEKRTFGFGELNEAGEELLSFLTTNVATVCNTWFTKKSKLGNIPSLINGTVLTM